jgi:fumarate hydratase class II
MPMTAVPTATGTVFNAWSDRVRFQYGSLFLSLIMLTLGLPVVLLLWYALKALGTHRGIEPNEKRIREHLDGSPMLVTALNPHIGYEKAAQISLKAYREDLSLREAALRLGFLTGAQFDEWVRPQDMTHPLGT